MDSFTTLAPGPLEWLINTRPKYYVFRRPLTYLTEPYLPSCFVLNFDMTTCMLVILVLV